MEHSPTEFLALHKPSSVMLYPVLQVQKRFYDGGLIPENIPFDKTVAFAHGRNLKK